MCVWIEWSRSQTGRTLAMTDRVRDWLSGFEPDEKCRVCGAAATAQTLCLAHLQEPRLAQALNDLRAGSLILDLRGVELDADCCAKITAALTPDGERGPNLSTARLTQASFGDGAVLRGATFGDGADLRGATFGDRADLIEARFGDGTELGGGLRLTSRHTSLI